MPYSNKEDQAEYQRLWCRKRREKYLGDKKCIKCGSVKNLEVDHIDPSKKISHRIWSWREDRIRDELKKCQFLCRVCHEMKTISERRGELSTSAKLTEDLVRSIFHLHKSGEKTINELSLKFGVARTTIRSIVYGKTWKHLCLLDR